MMLLKNACAIPPPLRAMLNVPEIPNAVHKKAIAMAAFLAQCLWRKSPSPTRKLKSPMVRMLMPSAINSIEEIPVACEKKDAPAMNARPPRVANDARK